MTKRRAGQRCKRLITCAVLLCPLAPAAAITLPPIDLSGDVGYTYRLMESDTDETVSHQMRGSIRGRSYLWQPWFATVDARLRLTQDDTDYSLNSNPGISGSTTTLTTGELDFSVIPRSRYPLSISYSAHDSRVDTIDTITSPLTAVGAREFSTNRFSVRQSLDFKKKGRYQWNYDLNNWKSTNSEEYSDWLLGGKGDWSWHKNRLQVRTNYKVIDRAVLGQESTNLTFNLDHFFTHPTRALRIDTSADHYFYETDPVTTGAVVSFADSKTSSDQVSSFIFWRPTDRPVTASGGVRVFRMVSDAGRTHPDVVNNETELLSVNATAGGMYQYTKNLRFDANANLSVNDTDLSSDEESDLEYSHLMRVGALMQSDMHEILWGMGYQWYASGSFQSLGTETEDQHSLDLSLGHDANKTWWNDQKNSTLRLGLSQAISSLNELGDDDSNSQRLDHSATFGWDYYGGRKTAYAAITLSDAREIGDRESDQQLINQQVSGTFNLTRRSSLTGNLTSQWVRQKFDGQDESAIVTTHTGAVNYQHSRAFGVPRLRFGSDLRHSVASEDRQTDRSEWENRLDYSVGLVDTRASWRLIDAGEQDYSLVYFQVTRRF